MKRTFAVSLAAAGMLLVFPAIRLSGEEKETKESETYQERFDHQVREDLFAGFNGDKEALKRGMKKCEEALKEKPDHAEAMVWLGGGRVFLAGEAFNRGDVATGMQNWAKGLAEMDKAIELEPDNIGVLIPRAAILLPAGRTAPPIIGKPVLQRVLKDFERAYARQKDVLEQLGEHPHGELRMGLADIYRLLGKPEKSKEQLLAIQKELPDTDYAERATTWLAAPPEKKLAHNCIGCHSN